MTYYVQSGTLNPTQSLTHTHLDKAKYSFRYDNFPLGVVGGTAASSVNLGPPHISETIRARKLKFYTHT